MRKLILKDETYGITQQIFAEDETDMLCDVITNLIANKYQSMDCKKIVEDRISDSKLYKVIEEILKELRNEPELRN